MFAICCEQRFGSLAYDLGRAFVDGFSRRPIAPDFFIILQSERRRYPEILVRIVEARMLLVIVLQAILIAYATTTPFTRHV